MSILQIRKERFRELNNPSEMTPLVSPGEVLAQVIWLTVLLALLSVQLRAQVPLDISCAKTFPVFICRRFSSCRLTQSWVRELKDDVMESA